MGFAAGEGRVPTEDPYDKQPARCLQRELRIPSAPDCRYVLTAVESRVWPVGLLSWDCRYTDFARLELADHTSTEVEN